MQMLKQMLRQIGHLHAYLQYADTDLPVLIMQKEKDEHPERDP